MQQPPKTVYIAHDNCPISNAELKLTITKKKQMSNAEDVAKVAASQGVQILYNALRIGPRLILRSAIELLRANMITRVLSAVVLLTVDTVSLVRGKISKKQYAINVTLAFVLLVGGTAGWTLGGDIIGIFIESAVMGIIASLIGAGVVGALFAIVWEKLVGLFIQGDVADMLDICNATFARLAEENKLNHAEIENVKTELIIDNAMLGNMFTQKNRADFAQAFIQPVVVAASSATTINQPPTP